MKAQHQEPTDCLSPIRRPRGRPFQKGNPGRKPGSLNRSTLIANSISHADMQDLVQKGFELAKQNDSRMLRFFLDRYLPRQQPVQIQLPAIKDHSDLADAYGEVVKAVCAGELCPADASAILDMFQKIRLLLPDLEVERRVRALETELKVLQRAQGLRREVE